MHGPVKNARPEYVPLVEHDVVRMERVRSVNQQMSVLPTVRSTLHFVQVSVDPVDTKIFSIEGYSVRPIDTRDDQVTEAGTVHFRDGDTGTPAAPIRDKKQPVFMNYITYYDNTVNHSFY